MAANQSYPTALQWNQLSLKVIRCSGMSPHLAARALVHTTMYDAWSVSNQKAISTSAGQIKELDRRNHTTKISKKAYSYVAYRVLMDLLWLALVGNNLVQNI